MTKKPDHRTHEPGPREDCPECVGLAYEPGWYKSLREHRVVARPSAVVVPDAAEVEVVVDEKAAAETTDDRRR